MTGPPPTLYFDFVDPISFLVERELAEVDAEVERAPFELRPPPAPLVGLDHPDVAPRWARARELAGQVGVTFATPDLVPWSRKAHELHLLAAEHGVSAQLRRATFEAYLLRGLDIGRVDVLVEIAREVGLDRTETKAVLDVDRLEATVAETRASARALGVTDTPALAANGALLEGFHNRSALGTFLRHP